MARKWLIAELNANGELDFHTALLWEFEAHNPIRFTNKKIKYTRDRLKYGYAFVAFENRHDMNKWHYVKERLESDVIRIAVIEHYTTPEHFTELKCNTAVIETHNGTVYALELPYRDMYDALTSKNVIAEYSELLRKRDKKRTFEQHVSAIVYRTRESMLTDDFKWLRNRNINVYTG